MGAELPAEQHDSLRHSAHSPEHENEHEHEQALENTHEPAQHSQLNLQRVGKFLTHIVKITKSVIEDNQV